MSFSSPDSAEEAEDFSETGLSNLLQRAAVSAGHAPLLGLKMSGQIPKEALKEFVLDKPYSSSGVWASRRQFRKRAGAGADCFWKYCV
ncbi:hypothetical protein DNTS_013826 [Danionella cerebrum]|uniref:Uncharacterized protein n=1 Tax=Danionella cerebrum TaxID=2873325 RepID=A0A553PXU5_9TELE|nr:hypothetical protein DNTS_013826 [Danionella translucida]